jgi:hypothetical protein
MFQNPAILQDHNFGTGSYNEVPRGKPEVSSFERKFIVLLGSMPRFEDRFTTFSAVTN